MDSVKESLLSFQKEAKKKYNQFTGQEPEPEEDPGILGELSSDFDETCKSCMPKMTRTERLYAVCWCFVIGLGCQVLGLAMLGMHNIKGFAIAYSCGTTASLTSSLFLFGPAYQLRNMFKETRIFATLVMLSAIALTIVSAIVWKNVLLCIIFVCIQFLAGVWYTLSFIPYARRIVTSCLSGMIGM
eukprot:m.130767 g.130767  ORF g.130767 m.130767 type:complete len:186 (-) comp11291_c1_seq1:313-870(-)